MKAGLSTYIADWSTLDIYSNQIYLAKFSICFAFTLSKVCFCMWLLRFNFLSYFFLCKSVSRPNNWWWVRSFQTYVSDQICFNMKLVSASGWWGLSKIHMKNIFWSNISRLQIHIKIYFLMKYILIWSRFPPVVGNASSIQSFCKTSIPIFLPLEKN